MERHYKLNSQNILTVYYNTESCIENTLFIMFLPERLGIIPRNKTVSVFFHQFGIVTERIEIAIIGNVVFANNPCN